MDVNSDELRAGAGRSHSASILARDGFEQLHRGTILSAMFGNFEAAEEFQMLAEDIHSNHLARLRDHQNGLGALGDNAYRTATAFDDMEDRNAAALRSVPWPYPRA